MTISGILENLISDVLFILFAVIFGWIIFRLSRRAKLLDFFGIGNSRRIAIYISNLRVKTGGAVGIDGQELSYQGSTAAFGETVEANRFRDLFNYLLPSLSENPSLLSKLLISDVQIQLLISPLVETEIEGSTSFISLGGPAYNIASRIAENRLHSKARFSTLAVEGTHTPPVQSSSNAESDYSGATGSHVQNITVLDTAAHVDPPQMIVPSGLILNQHQSVKQLSAIQVDGVPLMTETTYGFVERLIDYENKRSIFYIAGISELATAGAANYLISQWEKLVGKYGTQTGFLVVLRFDPDDYKRWSVIFER